MSNCIEKEVGRKDFPVGNGNSAHNLMYFFFPTKKKMDIIK